MIACRHLTGAAALLMLVLGAPDTATAQPATHGPADWPCVQRLIPELTPAVIWPDAHIEELDADWWEDEELARVVRYASARETAPDEALRRVNEFIESVGGGEREERLRLLFAGLFQEINRERSRTIAAVRRYAQGQVGQLERISGLVASSSGCAPPMGWGGTLSASWSRSCSGSGVCSRTDRRRCARCAISLICSRSASAGSFAPSRRGSDHHLGRRGRP